MESKLNCGRLVWQQASLFFLSVAVILMLSACSHTPSPISSLSKERAMGGDASKKMSDGMKLLMDSIQKPDSPFHFSSKAQENINPKFPHEPNSKPEIGSVEVEADVTAEEIDLSTVRGKQKKESKAPKTDQLGWPMAQLELTGALMEPGFALAIGGTTGRSAGSETVGGVAADKFDFDTSTAPASAQAGMKMAMAMLGGKTKFDSVKGSAWLDKATGRMVKFSIDSDLSDNAGNAWKEHHEVLVTPK